MAMMLVLVACIAVILKLYRDPDRLAETLPTIRYFARPRAQMAETASRLRQPSNSDP